MCDFKYSTQLIAVVMVAFLTNACSGGGNGGGGRKNKSNAQTAQDRKNNNAKRNSEKNDNKNKPHDDKNHSEKTSSVKASRDQFELSPISILPTNANTALAEPNIKVEFNGPWVAATEKVQVDGGWRKVESDKKEVTALSTTNTASEEKPTNQVEENLNVKIVYTKDVSEGSFLSTLSESQKNNYVQSVRKLYANMNVDGAYRAIPIVDNIYEKTHKPTEKSPYITVALYQAIVESGACDINATGACLVVESDDRINQNKKRAYFITSSPENAHSKIIRVARQNLNLTNDLVAAAEVATLGDKNQITVFSQVSSLDESRDLNKDTYTDSNSNNSLGVSNADMDKVTDEVISVLDSKSQKQINDRLAATNDRVDALAGHCFIAADLKVLRRFIGILLPRTYIDDAGQKKYKPTKEGKGRLYCYKRDGTRQAPKVQVQVIDRLISFGWRLSKGSEKFGAAALGWSIQGVQDIIAIGSFRYLVSVDSSLSNAFWNYLPGLWKVIGFYVRANITPIIWGGKKGVGGVLATAAGIGLNDNIWSEASVSLLGEIKINFDPDEL